MVTRLSCSIIPVNKCRAIDIVNNQIKITIIVQISIGSPIGKCTCINTPLPGHIRKCEIAIIFVDITDIRIKRHLLI